MGLGQDQVGLVHDGTRTEWHHDRMAPTVSQQDWVGTRIGWDKDWLGPGEGMGPGEGVGPKQGGTRTGWDQDGMGPKQGGPGRGGTGTGGGRPVLGGGRGGVGLGRGTGTGWDQNQI